MPQPANSRICCGSVSENLSHSAAQSPIHRRRSRRSNPPGRRSVRGRDARARRSWPEPPRSACRRRPHWDGERPPERGELGTASATAVTSVARCRTFGSSRTYGASGTFISGRSGDNARATDRDGVFVFLQILAGLCQGRSERQVADPGSPVRRMVPASTREGHQTHLPADQHLRRGAEKPSMGAYVQHRA